MRRFHQTCQYWLSNKNKNASWGLITAQVLGLKLSVVLAHSWHPSSHQVTKPHVGWTV